MIVLKHLDHNVRIGVYLYWVIFLGCLPEGATALILSGIGEIRALAISACDRMVTLAGNTCLEISCYSIPDGILGNACCPTLSLNSVPSNGLRVFQRYHTPSIFAVHFLYDMGPVSPMVIGQVTYHIGVSP